MLRLIISILALLTLAAGAAQSQTRPRPTAPSNTRTPLLTGWQFREAGQEKWYPASVPGCVHTDLLNNKLIGDPFYRDNEQQLQWIGKTFWTYQTTFLIRPAILDYENIELVFQGLDTYATVILNDIPLLNADNMFRRWRVD